MRQFASPARRLGALLLVVLPGTTIRAADEPGEKIASDFEAPAGIKTWFNLVPPGVRDKEPPARIEQSVDHATPGKHSLKLTFSGGQRPTAATEAVSQDWLAYQTFKADVTVTRSCVVGFTCSRRRVGAATAGKPSSAAGRRPRS